MIVLDVNADPGEQCVQALREITDRRVSLWVLSTRRWRASRTTKNYEQLQRDNAIESTCKRFFWDALGEQNKRVRSLADLGQHFVAQVETCCALGS